MRSINATLEAALLGGSFDAYIKVRVVKGAYDQTFDVREYELTATILKVTLYGNVLISSLLAPTYITLIRGVTISGTNYTLSTSPFISTTGFIHKSDSQGVAYSKIEAHLINPIYLSFLADGTYEDAISDFSTALGKTYTLKDSTADHWQYQFLPDGRNFTSNNAQSFLTLLRQKYFIYCCDNGSDDLLFFCGVNVPSGAQDYHIYPEDVYDLQTGFMPKRRFYSRDENSSVTYSGTAGDTLHNLGFILSTDAAPTLYEQTQGIEPYPVSINLIYQDGDYVNFADDEIFLYPALVREIFNPKLNKLTWRTEVSQHMLFSNTEGGYMPSTIEAAAPYTPLSTLSFDNNLDPSVNNLQALAEAVDELILGTIGRELLTENRTYYVRTDGDDGNAGLVNDADGAFLTVQRAIDVASALDNNGYNITVQLADGTYSENIFLKQCVGTGTVTIVGNVATPANVIIAGTTACFSSLGQSTTYTLSSMKLTGTGSTIGIDCRYSSIINYTSLVFHSSFLYHIQALFGGNVICSGDYFITAGASNAHWSARSGGGITFQGRTISIYNAITFTQFAECRYSATMFLNSSTFTLVGGATVTAKRYLSDLNAVIQTAGGGANYLPGNAAGVTATGGQYA